MRGGKLSNEKCDLTSIDKEDYLDILYNIFKKDQVFHEKIEKVSPICMDFICRCITEDPSERMSVQEMLSHTFLTDHFLNILGISDWKRSFLSRIRYTWEISSIL